MEYLGIGISIVSITSLLMFFMSRIIKKGLEDYIIKSIYEHYNICYKERQGNSKDIIEKLDILDGKIMELKEEFHIFQEKIKIKLNI